MFIPSFVFVAGRIGMQDAGGCIFFTFLYFGLLWVGCKNVVSLFMYHWSSKNFVPCNISEASIANTAENFPYF